MFTKSRVLDNLIQKLTANRTGPIIAMKKFTPIQIFRKSMRILIDVLIIYIIVVMGVGLFKTIYSIEALFSEPIGSSFNKVITDILTFLVIIELFRSFVEYFEMHRFRLHTLITPAMVFLLRELIVMLYNQKISSPLLFSFGFVILCLGIVRTLAVHFSPVDEHDNPKSNI